MNLNPQKYTTWVVKESKNDYSMTSSITFRLLDMFCHLAIIILQHIPRPSTRRNLRKLDPQMSDYDRTQRQGTWAVAPSKAPRPHFYQTRSAWSVDQGSNKNHSPAYNFTPTVTKFCVMWEGLSLPHDTEFGNCRCKIVDSRSFPSWSLIHGLRWSGLIKVGPG